MEDINARVEEDSRYDSNDQDESKPDKKIRKRKKKLFQAIRSQMEFYFSNSNLLKDKFLSRLMYENESGLIDLAIFLRFNKIRAITSDLQDIASALSRSELLEVSEDGTQVKRKLPVVEREDIDECTIYVEHLPAETDHNWLTSVFNNFGTINYISLPRYKHTGKLKGFAFVEFENIESAQQACKYFGVVPENPPLQQENEDSVLDIEKVENTSKRKRETSESDDSKGKQLKVDAKEVPDAHITGSAVIHEEANDVSSAKDKKHKKKRKRKKKQKVEEEEEPVNLRVMSKIEWKRWRNKYLSLQKATTAQIKKSLLGEHFPAYRNYTPTHRDESQDQTEIEEPEKIVKSLEFQPGVIVRVQLEQPLTSVSDFKKQARTITNVEYIEAMEGDATVYIRCSDAKSASTYFKSTRSGLRGTAIILEGEEEQVYWEKIQRDRENKFLKKPKQKKRGIEKVMTKAEKIVEKSRHIRFEED